MNNTDNNSQNPLSGVNFLLSEISLQLLGNEFYNIHGIKKDDLRDLFDTAAQIPPGISNLESELDLENIASHSENETLSTAEIFKIIKLEDDNDVNVPEEAVAETARTETSDSTSKKKPFGAPSSRHDKSRLLISIRDAVNLEFTKLSRNMTNDRLLYIDEQTVDGVSREEAHSRYDRMELGRLNQEKNALINFIRYIKREVNDSKMEEMIKFVLALKQKL